MSDLLNIESLALVVYLVVPGYVALKAYDLMTAGVPRRLGDSLIELFALSLINAALFGRLLGPLSDWFGRPLATIAFIFVAPVGLALIVHLIRRSHWTHGVLLHPDPTAWDFYFRDQNPCWVLCHLKSGKLVGGVYALDSFASSLPVPTTPLHPTSLEARFRRPLPGANSQ